MKSSIVLLGLIVVVAAIACADAQEGRIAPGAEDLVSSAPPEKEAPVASTAISIAGVVQPTSAAPASVTRLEPSQVAMAAPTPVDHRDDSAPTISVQTSATPENPPATRIVPTVRQETSTPVPVENVSAEQSTVAADTPEPESADAAEETVGHDPLVETVNRPPTYLEATVEPCLMVKPGVDPCGAADQNESIGSPLVEVEASFAGWTAVSIEDDMIGRSVNERFGYTHAPHFVVRGTYLPGTTRCAVTGLGAPLSSVISEGDDELLAVIATAEARFEADPEALKKLPKTYPPTLVTCVTDLAVNEYMVGRGPDTLTIQTFWRVAFLYIPDFYERYEADPDYDFGYDLWELDFADGVAQPIEGKEKVIWVGAPQNLAVKAWRPVETWDVVREGAEILVARDDAQFHINRPDDYALIVHPLDEYRQKVGEAHAKLVEMHDGRMGDHEDLPMLVLDANDDFLEELLVVEGAYQFNKTPLSITAPDPDFQYPTPTPAPPPPSPTPSPVYLPVVDLKAKVVQTNGALAVELTWVQPDDDNVITRYQVMREEINDPDGDLIGGNVSSKKEPIAPETSFVDDLLLEPGSTYTYRIRTHGLNFKFVTSELVTITIPSE